VGRLAQIRWGQVAGISGDELPELLGTRCRNRWGRVSGIRI